MIPRLYISIDLTKGTRFAAEPRAAHYLKNVLRRSLGDTLILFNGRDGEFSATIIGMSKKDIEIEITDQRRTQTSVPDIWLCFAPLKKDAIDFLIEKATELGVTAFQPVFTQHTSATRLNLERLTANAIEAAEQTERLSLPDVRQPVSLNEMLKDWDPARRLILCAEAGPAHPMAQALHKLKQDVNETNTWAVFCGPEGGFARSELDLLSKLPFVIPVGLGPRILRADTAALAALAVFQSILGDGDQRPPTPLLPIGQLRD